MTPPPAETAGGNGFPATARLPDVESTRRPAVLAARILGLTVAAFGILFVVNNYLIFWRGWPGLFNLFGQIGWFGLPAPRQPLDGTAIALGWIQFFSYVAVFAGIVAFVLRKPGRGLYADAESLTAISAFIARAAFWAVVFIGLADAFISFLRVEGLLVDVVGKTLAADLGRSAFRGLYVHYPLMAIGLVIAAFTRSIGFLWLSLLVVVAELMIVFARFVFSYEQAFMGDLVRFWYGALFLFASAYTLLKEGHVRVDILYTGFSERGKAWTNTLGSLFLGVPLCWVILTRGMWTKSTLINSALLNFEVSQSGYGMYVKYLMAGFLVVYALSMLIQFASHFLSSIAVLLGEPKPESSGESEPSEQAL